MATQDTIVSNLSSVGFDNPSQTAIYNKLAEACGLAIDTTLVEINNSELRIKNVIDTQRYGKNGNYTDIALGFQFGDNLIVDPITKDYYYAVEDKAKKIITQAAFEEIISGSSSQLFIKIATLNKVTGLLEQLPIIQFNAFASYFKIFEIPGLPVSIINSPGNILSFNVKVTYYATYDLPTLQSNLGTALNTFRDSFAFNGVFYDSDLSQYIKDNVPGVRSFYIYNSTVDSSPYTGDIKLGSGYFNYAANILNNILYFAI